MKIKVKDKVLVTAGKYKGKTGVVMRVLEKQGKVTVEKVNIRTRHIKKTATHAGQRLQYEAPLAVSNVKLICPSCNKTTRVGYKMPDKGKKYRICKKCSESVEQAKSKVEKKK
ncbi:50S ribosomal protein L24 [Patescibacteria group bacterium]|nr:50S ribosomal protein L24 [Patescibacteria group bacterium]MBU1016437.1 50S ribosomal protein L24 [Patescibacteria group bacterium]MBU1684935.1 50S ribosomal protein L24 [Patescibacteria group bacterium]MBU1939037.1 50S ribosomal protein L24 [Patescibacteria group bacterium]